ncbi:MAG TPA: TonB-dependent receptor [Saprospiraceae bacterium]|jgi:ferric enterobactin receptor|nr:TonB-dependent receptor [Saprospiraceae bacterium]HPI04776.1 TonB-dependent receptor [Saprospiraceae bacterium]
MKNILLFLLLTASFSLFAQKSQGGSNATMLPLGRLYGKVIDAISKEPIAYASVTVLRTLSNGQDSLIGGALTLGNGDFNVTGVSLGLCKVNVSYMGNKDVVKSVKISAPGNVEQDLGNLAMTADMQVLGTVDVQAEKSSTTISLEKRVFNVEKNITATGGTAEDVLKNVPSVTVDMDGNAKLRDKEATVYVDGKPTLMTLNQIPSDQIESVEVISNPSAKYEAATMGGILNIVLKKNRKPGYSGLVGLGVGTQDRYNGMLQLNANEGKWNISGFYNINSSGVQTDAYVNRTNLNTEGTVQNYFNQNSLVTFKNTFQTGRVNVDYAINNRNTLSVSGTLSGGQFDVPVVQDYASLSTDRLVTSYGVRQTLSENDFSRNSVETQWKKTYATKNKSLIAFVNYAWSNSGNTGSWNTTDFDASGQPLPEYPELVEIAGKSNNQQAVFQLDFVNPVNDSTKVEMGIRSFFSGRDQDYFFNRYDYTANAFLQVKEFSQDTRITESINAAYVTYSGRLKKQIDYQVGLRFEQSGMTGLSRLEGTSDFGYSYPHGTGKDLLRSFFPSVYLSKKVNALTEIGLNFSRKIQRPNPRQLMPGIQANDKQNIQIGNPNLQPEFINLAELNYNKIFGAHNWLATLYLSNETNSLKPLIRVSEADPSVLVTSFVNGTNELTYGLENTLKLAFGKNLDIMLNANVFKFKVNVDTFSNDGWAANGKASINYRLPAAFSIQLNGAYEGNRPIPQGNRQGIAYMDIGVKKSFFRNAINVTFSVNDVFNSRRDITVFTQPTYIQEAMRRRDARFFKLSVQATFGRSEAFTSKKSNKRPDGEEVPDFSGN